MTAVEAFPSLDEGGRDVLREHGINATDSLRAWLTELMPHRTPEQIDETIARGTAWAAEHEVAEVIRDKFPGSLTEREIRVLDLLAEGLSIDGAAAVLFVSPETIKSHSKNIRAALEARNTPHAVRIGMRRGFIQ